MAHYLIRWSIPFNAICIMLEQTKRKIQCVDGFIGTMEPHSKPHPPLMTLVATMVDSVAVNVVVPGGTVAAAVAAPCIGVVRVTPHACMGGSVGNVVVPACIARGVTVAQCIVAHIFVVVVVIFLCPCHHLLVVPTDRPKQTKRQW